MIKVNKMEDLVFIYIKDVKQRFRSLKALADRTLSQIRDEELSRALDEEGNSVMILMKHLSGNIINRWTDPFASDEDKPPRYRDNEFVVTDKDTKKTVFDNWENAWAALFLTLECLSSEDMSRIVSHMGRSSTLMEALNSQMIHYAQHVGQMIFLGKHFRKANWGSLSIPRKS